MAVTTPLGPRPRRTGGRSARVRAAVLRAYARRPAGRRGGRPVDPRRRGAGRGARDVDLPALGDQGEPDPRRRGQGETQAAIPAPDTGSAARATWSPWWASIAAFITTPAGEVLLRLALRDDLPEDRDRSASDSGPSASPPARRVLQRAEARGELRLRPGLPAHHRDAHRRAATSGCCSPANL